MTTGDLDGCWTVADFTDECHVRALCANADQMEIILDSGADISCLPSRSFR